MSWVHVRLSVSATRQGNACTNEDLGNHRWATERRDLRESLSDIEFKQLRLKPRKCHATPHMEVPNSLEEQGA
jgi:hypothetical protein